MQNMAKIFMLNNRNNPIAWYRLFLDTLYSNILAILEALNINCGVIKQNQSEVGQIQFSFF